QNLDAATTTQEFLHRELSEANASVDEASRALATFLAHHPQFQWGLNDSPYAPSLGGAPGAPIVIPGRPPPPPSVKRPVGPELASVAGELARVAARIAPPSPVLGDGPRPPSSIAAAQKQRDTSAAALASAEATLRERLASLTPAHPDAVSAQAKVAAARR